MFVFTASKRGIKPRSADKQTAPKRRTSSRSCRQDLPFPIIDCFDGIPVSWTIGTSPSSGLANAMLDKAIKTLKPWEKPIVHSDRGGHYRWDGWISRMESRGLTRSMSKKGCSPDNSACEGFFGRIKNEVFYGRDWKGWTLDDFMYFIDRYLNWFRNERIKIGLNNKSPKEYRTELGLAL